jgi:tRNA A-37 threonylcarbamoyl transferase component Bud32
MEASGSKHEPGLLTVETVGPYLRSRGLADSASPLEAIELGGGVSNVVISVTSGTLRAVVKQALSKLRVAEEWVAKRERTITEARALQLAGQIEPGSVPNVIDLDPVRGVVVIDRAPDGWHNYKEMLLAGVADRRVAERCGEILASWHASTWGDEKVEASFDDLEAFDQLRVDPYYRTAAARRPEVASEIHGYIKAMSRSRAALVHGDFSPKNVLAGGGKVWILDFEVAHFGDPAFDVAFMMNHLMLKAIYRYSSSAGYERCVRDFWRAYKKRLRPRPGPRLEYVFGHVGCLMLARVDGKSPAEYLNESGRASARDLAMNMLRDPPKTIDEAWMRLALARPRSFPAG